MYPVPASESIIAATLDSSLKDWGQDSTERRMQVKNSETGELISYSSWFFYPQREGEDWKKMPEAHFPHGWYHSNALSFQISHIEARNKIMGPKPYLCTVSPNVLDTFSSESTFKIAASSRRRHSPAEHMMVSKLTLLFPRSRNLGDLSGAAAPGGGLCSLGLGHYPCPRPESPHFPHCQSCRPAPLPEIRISSRRRDPN